MTLVRLPLSVNELLHKYSAEVGTKSTCAFNPFCSALSFFTSKTIALQTFEVKALLLGFYFCWLKKCQTYENK
jgi:hypothetical protein